jgi:hypothetical protein
MASVSTNSSGIDRVTPGFTIIVGKPASGKTHLLKYLLSLDHPDYNANPLRYGVVFTTTKFNRFWEEIVPSKYIHSKYNADVLRGLMDIQAAGANRQNRAFVIFDDCLDQKAFASQLFADLSTTFRHFNLDVYIVTQYIYRVPPVVRECATRAALFRTTTERSISACFESFGAFFEKSADFRKFMIEHSGDYSFIWYIANSSKEKAADVYIPMKCPENIESLRFDY